MLKRMLLVISIIICIAGCSSEPIVKPSSVPSATASSSVAVAQQDSPEGYIASEANFAMYMRWTEVNKNLTGQLQVFAVQSSDRKTQGVPSGHAFTGVLDGENISVTFPLTDSWAGQTWTGTIKDKTLTLLYPSADGRLVSIELHPGAVDIFNEMVAGLQNSVSTANDRAKQEATLKAQQQAETDRVKKEQNAVVYANGYLKNDFQALNSKIIEHDQMIHTFDAVLQSSKDHFAELQNADAQLKRNASAPTLTDIMIADIESELAGMESINASIESDQASMESEQATVDTYLSSLNDLVVMIPNDWHALQNAVSVNSSGVPSPDYDQQNVDSVLKSIRQEIDAVNSVAKKKHGTANGYLASSKQIINEATNLVNGLKSTE